MTGKRSPPRRHRLIRTIACALTRCGRGTCELDPASATRRLHVVVADDVPEEARASLAALGGKLALKVWDHSRLVSVASERAEVERSGAKIEQTASQNGDTIVADVRITSDVGQLTVRSAMPAGKTTILAQAANTEKGVANGSIFYVVRASLAP